MAFDLLLRFGRLSNSLCERGRSQQEVAGDILSYFLRNPEAADTFDGIVRWRLLGDIVRRNIEATEEALTWLIEQGYLKRESIPGSKPVFLLNSNMREKAKRFLAKHSKPNTKKSAKQKR